MQAFAESVAESFESEVSVNWKLNSTMHVVAFFSAKSIAVEMDFEQRYPMERGMFSSTRLMPT
jgi:hypothetical protein